MIKNIYIIKNNLELTKRRMLYEERLNQMRIS